MRRRSFVSSLCALAVLVPLAAAGCKAPTHAWAGSLSHEMIVDRTTMPSSALAEAPSPSVFPPTVEALTTPAAGGGLMLFVYAQQAAEEITILTAHGWHTLPYAYTAQSPRWTTIRSTYAPEEWANGKRITVRLRFADGTATEVDAPIEHR
jgi:hypothetical protein